MAKDIKFRISLNIDGKEHLVTATTSAKELTANFDKAKGSAVKLQDAMVKFASISSIIDNVGRAVSSLAGQLSEYQKGNLDIQQQTGLTGDAMTKLRSEIQAVADTYDKEFNEVLLGASTMMKGFGISSDEAMRLVRDGLMSGADATGQMFDILKEYPTYFKEAGLTAEQFMAIITNGANMGVFNDKAADTIKEGNLRLREMTKATKEALDGIGLDSDKIQEDLKSGMTTTFEVMQQIGAKLKELPQTSAEVGTAIADIFGGPGEDAGLKYIESLSVMSLEMKTLKDKAMDTSKALDGQIDRFSGINSMISLVVNNLNAIPGLQPFLNISSQLAMTTVGVSTLVKSFKILNVVEAITELRTKGIAASMAIYRTVQVTTNAIVAASAGLFKTAAVGATTLKVAIRGLLVATGVGAAIVALTIAIEALIGKSETASSSMGDFNAEAENLKAAQELERQAISQVTSELTLNIAKLKDFKGSKEEEKKLVSEMNSKYGAAIGYYSNVADWYTALVANSKAYCQQMINEIKIRNLANEAVEHEGKARDIAFNEDGSLKKYSGKRELETYKDNKSGRYGYREKRGSSDAEKATAAYRREMAMANKAKNEMQKLIQQNASISYKHTSGYSSTNPITTTPSNQGGKTGGTTKNTGTTAKADPLKGSIDWYESAISDLNQKAQATADEATATALVSEKKKLEDELKQLKIRVGIEEPNKQEVQEAAEKPLDLSTREGKRERYSQLQQQASTVQSDLDMGIIVDKTKAQEELDAINNELKKLNLEPIKIEFETNADKAAKKVQEALSALSNIDLTSMDSVKGAFKNIADITDPTTKGFAAAGAACSALGGAMQQLGADSEAAKAGMVMAAIGEIVLSFAEALRSAKTWVEWLAFGISGTAMMVSLISTISGFKDGGIVGGNSKSGDKLIARVNSGEMILNTQQQQRLWNIVNGSTGYQSMAGAAAQNIGGNFRMTVSGRNLVGVLANETRVSSKSGKRTNIVI